MTDAERLTVFISWSGGLSKAIAAKLRDWLPDILDNIDPWMSDKDIESGARGLEEISTTLDRSCFGIIVVTPDNHAAPWVNFESGAISRSLQDAKNRVVPLLVDMKVSDITGPLAQFQARSFDEDGMRRVIEALARQVPGADETRVLRRFASMWPDLEEAVKGIDPTLRDPKGSAPKRPLDEMVREILDRVRELGRDGRGDQDRVSSKTSPKAMEQIFRDLGATAGKLETGRVTPGEGRRRLAMIAEVLSLAAGHPSAMHLFTTAYNLERELGPARSNRDEDPAERRLLDELLGVDMKSEKFARLKELGEDPTLSTE